MTKCNKCHKECLAEFSFCPKCGQILRNEGFKKNEAREKWELLRDKITLTFCMVILTVFSVVGFYVLVNASYFPKDVAWSVLTLMSLVVLTFVGQITKTPSIKQAVASAIERFSLQAQSRRGKITTRSSKGKITNS